MKPKLTWATMALALLLGLSLTVQPGFSGAHGPARKPGQDSSRDSSGDPSSGMEPHHPHDQGGKDDHHGGGHHGGHAPFDPHFIKKTHGRTLTVTYQTEPTTVRFDEGFALRVTLVPNQAPPPSLRPIALRLRTVMMEEGLPMNTQPVLTPQPDGTILAKNMLFHLKGHWRVHLEIDFQGRTDRTFFDFMCCK